ncbi:MAG: hypothetical protein ABI921_11225 [Panacibacter sp.]
MNEVFLRRTLVPKNSYELLVASHEQKRKTLKAHSSPLTAKQYKWVTQEAMSKELILSTKNIDPSLNRRTIFIM